MARQIVNVTAIEKKSKTHKVTPYATGFKVKSGKSNDTYFVVLSPIARCNCRWGVHTKRGMPCGCGHVMAARAFVAEQNGYKAKFRRTDKDVSRLHRKTEIIGNGVQLTLRRA